MLQEYDRMLDGAQVAVVTSYQGLTVSELTGLRRQLRSAGIELHVVKNTLAHKALEERGISTAEELWQGANALGVSHQDAVAAAKAILDAARTEQRFVVKAGILGTQFITKEDVTRLAALPSRDVLLGQLLASMQSPIVSVVTVLSGTLRGLVNVLDARSRQLQEAEG